MITQHFHRCLVISIQINGHICFKDCEQIIIPRTIYSVIQIFVTSPNEAHPEVFIKMKILMIYCNFKGLYADGISNGFLIDSSPPEIEEGPVFTRDFGLVGNTQFFRSSVKVRWKVADPESHIERQYLSLRSHLGGYFALSSTQVNIYSSMIVPLPHPQ